MLTSLRYFFNYCVVLTRCSNVIHLIALNNVSAFLWSLSRICLFPLLVFLFLLNEPVFPELLSKLALMLEKSCLTVQPMRVHRH